MKTQQIFIEDILDYLLPHVDGKYDHEFHSKSETVNNS